MGTSGDMSTSNQYVKYHITIDQGAQSVANNNTNVTVSVYFWRTNSGYSTYGNGTVYCKINGTTYSASVGVSQKITSSGITLFSKNLDIGHNSDGTKTLDTSAWISIDAPLSSSEQWYSQTLTTIPRTSQPSLSSGTVTMGNSVTIYTNRASDSFTHNIYYQYGSTGWQRFATGVATSYTWTVPTSFANDTPNSTSLGVSIIQETYASGTYIGDKSVGMTATVPSSYVPTINSVTLSETVSGIASKFGGYVQSKSKIQGVVSASGSHGSTISSYSSNTNSQSFSSSTFTTNELVNSGSQNVSTTVTDSRGRTSSTTTTNYTVIPYANPTITTFTVARANSSGIEDDQGTYVLCTINANISPVNDLNDKSFKIKYKKKLDSTYSETVITPIGTTYTYNSTYLVSGIDADYEYDFRLELIDYFLTVTSDKSIPTAFTLMDFNLSGKGIAFGKVSAMNGFEVEMPAVFGDDVEIDGNITQTNYFNGRRMQYVPVGIGTTTGWYLALSGTTSLQYENVAFVLNVTETLSGATGVLYGNIRVDNYVLSVNSFRLSSAGNGLPMGNFILKVSGSNFYLYAKTTGAYQCYLFEVVSESTLTNQINTPTFTFNAPGNANTVSTPTGTSPSSYGPQVLYSNASGTNGTITLSETAANFSYFEIYFWGDGYDIIKVYNPNGKKAALFSGNASGGTVYMYYSGINISGTSITWSDHYWAWGTSTLTVQTTGNGKIYYVVGYR